MGGVVRGAGQEKRPIVEFALESAQAVRKMAAKQAWQKTQPKGAAPLPLPLTSLSLLCSVLHVLCLTGLCCAVLCCAVLLCSVGHVLHIC